MEWSIGELSRRAGISTRTLRHYDHIKLLAPSRRASNGVRFYDTPQVVRLQRILLLREIDMSLATIADVLDDESPEDEIRVLQAHLRQLEAERAATERRMDAVRHVIQARLDGVDPQPDVLLEGFNDRYEAEVVERWGREAFEAGNDWWHGKSFAEQKRWKADSDQLLSAWAAAHHEGKTIDSPDVDKLVARHVAWLAAIPGTPTYDGDKVRSVAMIRGLAHLYVQDPNLRRAFGGDEAASFVRDALLRYVGDAPAAAFGPDFPKLDNS